jgi:hypothetical protein
MNLLGSSNRTSIAGYILAAFIAIQPILMEDMNFNSRSDWFRYAVRLVGAALVAVMGRQSADSKQVKEVKADVKANNEKIQEHKEEIAEVKKKVEVQSKNVSTRQNTKQDGPKKTPAAKKKITVKKKP